MKVLVPNNLNVPELIEELNLSNRRQKYVKEKIYHLISRVVATHKNIKKFDKNGSYCIFLLSDGAGNFLTQKSFYRVTESIGENRPNSYDLNFFSLDLVREAKNNKSYDDISVAIIYIDF